MKTKNRLPSGLMIAALGALFGSEHVANRLSSGVGYNPGPALPPQSAAEDARRIAAAEAKRARKAAKKLNTPAP